MRDKENSDRWLTLGSAARLAGRSYTWAWCRAATNVFERNPDGGRRILVSAQSVHAAIAREQVAKKSAGGAKGTRLRLVVDNAK